MSVSVNPPKTPVTKGSNGTAAATIPNVCKMPGPPAPFVPAPLPNIGKSGNSPKDYSQDVTFEGKAVAIRGSTFESIGDMASKATGGGMISANTHGITKFVGPGSMDVKIEGKNVQLLSDPMLNNCGPSGSPPNAATMEGIIQMSTLVTAVGERTCPLCGANDHDPLEETHASRADAAALEAAYAPQELAEYNAAFAEWQALPRPQQRRRRRPSRRSTMLGVVWCKCPKKYADQSGPTSQALVNAAGSGWITHPPATNRGNIGARIAEITGNSDAFQAMWTLSEEYSGISNENAFLPIGYPPGSCAAQGAIVRCLDDKGYPAALTERWYSPSNQTTGRPIWHVQAGPGGQRTLVTDQAFAPGDTVPPCETCSTVLPWLLCFKKEDPCPHG
jgi:hypothetical protein